MSAYTTLYITKEEAISKILNRVMNASDSELSNIVSSMERDTLYNYIVTEYPEDYQDY